MAGGSRPETNPDASTLSRGAFAVVPPYLSRNAVVVTLRIGEKR